MEARAGLLAGGAQGLAVEEVHAEPAGQAVGGALIDHLVDDDETAARAQHPVHLRETGHQVRPEVDRLEGRGHVEVAVREGHVLHAGLNRPQAPGLDGVGAEPARVDQGRGRVVDGPDLGLRRPQEPVGGGSTTAADVQCPVLLADPRRLQAPTVQTTVREVHGHEGQVPAEVRPGEAEAGRSGRAHKQHGASPAVSAHPVSETCGCCRCERPPGAVCGTLRP